MLIKLVLLSSLCANISWGSEKLFSFFSDHKIGTIVASGDKGINELSKLEIQGSEFSAYYELGDDKSIINAGLYRRINTSDASASELNKVFSLIRAAISAENGEAEIFEIPNFEDASERTHLMVSWKNESCILILQKLESASIVEVDVRHLKFDHFKSDLGADFGAFVLPRVESKSGKLKVPPSMASSSGGTEASDPSHKQRGLKVEAGSDRDLALRNRADIAPKKPIEKGEKSDATMWLVLKSTFFLIMAGFLMRFIFGLIRRK